MITCKSGVTIRMKVSDISEQGRATQGVKLIRIDEGDEIAAITKIDVQGEEEILNGEAVAEATATGEPGGETAGEEPTNSGENPSEEENPVQS
jgi:DNA gyrase subunit A